MNALIRAKRTLRLLSDCNAALVHSDDEPELLAKVCQLIVDVGGYRLVWIGYAQHDADKSVLPVAQFGFSQTYIQGLNITWSDSERGQGPTGLAFRSGQTQIARNILQDPRFLPWRVNALAHGFSSSIALPLKRSGHTFGALNIYAQDADAFDLEEIQLLEELADNVAYGVSAFQLREERNNALHEARKRDRIYRAVVEQSVEGISIARFDGSILMTNPACVKMTGYSEEELCRLKIHNLVLSNTKPMLYSLVTENKSGIWELEILRKDGSQFSAEVHAYPIALSNVEGEERAILGIVTDITKRKRDEAEKNFLQKQALHNARLASVGVMAAGIVHEVNNPNNAILFNSNLLANAWKDIEIILYEYYWENGDFSLGGLPFTEMCQVLPTLIDGIAEHSARIQNIINNMRYISREGQGGMTSNLDLANILEMAVSLLKNQISQRTNHLTLKTDDLLPQIRGNRQQLEQVFINIITNALQSLTDTEQAVHVMVTAMPGLDSLLVTVCDEGIGIVEKHLRRLTEPFFSTKLAEGGSGLGLFISNKIIENHGGEITFDSKPGNGTTVSIRLPVADDRAAPPLLPT